MLSIFKVVFLVNTLVMPSTCQGIVCGIVPEYKEAVKYEAQTLTIKSEATISAARDNVSVGLSPVSIHAASASESVFIPLPNGSLVQSASRYVGMNWDCTMLVEQALRDIGINVGDVGPMGFGSAGSVFNDPSQVQAGDIMMRGGHVAIYLGDGFAIHGGYNGRVAIIPTLPSEFYSFVRLG